jgi:MinD-like ATPase involved in chromosome partitioning or flagellar assembly
MDGIAYPTQHIDVDVIPLLIRNENKLKLVIYKKLPKLINELKRRYDYIILNTTPINESNNTKYLMSFSDINLITFKEEFTKKGSVLNINKLLKENKIDNSGAIFMQEFKKSLLINK